MNFLQYLRFIPLLMQLVEFIREAEAEFRGPDNGPQKLQWVVNRFVPLVVSFAGAGLIPQKLADALGNGASAIITIIVQLMNATGGVKPAEPPVVVDQPPATPPTATDPTTVEYDTLGAARDATTTANSTVWQKPNGKYVVWPSQFPGPGVRVYP